MASARNSALALRVEILQTLPKAAVVQGPGAQTGEGRDALCLANLAGKAGCAAGTAFPQQLESPAPTSHSPPASVLSGMDPCTLHPKQSPMNPMPVSGKEHTSLHWLPASTGCLTDDWTAEAGSCMTANTGWPSCSPVLGCNIWHFRKHAGMPPAFWPRPMQASA